MKKFSKLIICLFLLNTETDLQAAKPKYLLEPLTSTHFHLAINQTRIVQYRVTNNTAIARDLKMDPIPGINILTNRPYACPDIFHLNPQQSCILYLQLNKYQFATGFYQFSPHICVNNSRGFECSQPSIDHSLAVTIVLPAILDTVGKTTPNNTPQIIQSTSGGESWTIPSSSLPTGCTTGQFNSTACAGSGSTALCVAAGYCANSYQPLLVQSTNGGSSWSAVSIANLPTIGSFNSTSCVVNNGRNICVAGGYSQTSHTSSTSTPLAVQTIDNGDTWTVPVIEGAGQLMPNQLNQISQISCTTEDCAAILAPETNYLVIGVTYANEWSVQMSTSATTVIFTSGACEPNFTCFGVGYNPKDNDNDVIISGPGSSTSGTEQVLQLSTQYFRSGAVMSCSDYFCVAAGTTANSQLVQINYTGNSNGDGHIASSYITISNAPTDYTITSISCTGNSNSDGLTSCIAVGQNNITSQPFIAQSIANGTWTTATAPSYSGAAFLSSVSCTSTSSNNIFCIASGSQGTLSSPQDTPIVAVLSPNDDGVLTWSDATVLIPGLSTGHLYSTGSTS